MHNFGNFSKLWQLIIIGVKKGKVVQYHCTWTSPHYSISTHFQNKQNRTRDYENKHREYWQAVAVTFEIVRINTDWEIITTRQPLYNLISVTKYYSGDKTASFTDLNLM